MTMKDIHSGYASGPADWLAFLHCWRETVQARLAKRPGYSGLHALPPGINLLAEAPGDVADEVARLQDRLKVQLPRSYLDFAQARRGQGWVIETFADSSSLAKGVDQGVLPLAKIGKFADLDAVTLSRWVAGGAGSRAIRPYEYYRYGYQSDMSRVQDSALFNVETLQHMIKIGDLDQGAVLLLNPREITTDGEMEAWTLSFRTHAQRFRSFAELMQDLAYVDADPDHAESALVVAQLYERCPCVKLLRTAASL